jgi:hypothetical protein
MGVTFTFSQDSCIGVRCECREMDFPEFVGEGYDDIYLLAQEDSPAGERARGYLDHSCVHNSFDMHLSNANAGAVLVGLRLGAECMVGEASPSYILCELDSPFNGVPVRYRDSLRALALAALESSFKVGWA